MASVNVAFSEAINTSTFTYQDLTLACNGSAVPLTSAVTVSLVSGTTYCVDGLAAFTGSREPTR